MREPFAPARAVAPRPEAPPDRVWLARVHALAARDEQARCDYLAPWVGEPLSSPDMATAIGDMRAAESEAELWAASAAWGRAVVAEGERLAAAIRAERSTVTSLRAALARGTDADLARLAVQTGGVPVGGRAELVAGLAMRAATIAVVPRAH